MVNGSYDASIYSEKRITEEILRLSKSVQNDKNIIEKCIKLLDCENSYLLDLGCGPGATTNLISEALSDTKVCGIDREDRFISYAKKMYKKDNINFYVGDGENLPFEDNCFNVCFSRYVFQHLKNPQKVLCELIRVTKPEGYIGIYEWDEGLAEFTKYPDYYDEYIKAEKIRRRFTSGDINMGSKLKDLFINAGLIEVKNYFMKKDTNDPGREALWSGQKWMDEINENHPYVKMGIMKLEHLYEYYKSLEKIIFSEENYVCYTDVYTIGKVKKNECF